MFLCLFLLLAALARRALCAVVSLRLFPSCVPFPFACLRVLAAFWFTFPGEPLLGCGFPVVGAFPAFLAFLASPALRAFPAFPAFWAFRLRLSFRVPSSLLVRCVFSRARRAARWRDTVRGCVDVPLSVPATCGVRAPRAVRCCVSPAAPFLRLFPICMSTCAHCLLAHVPR